MLLEVQHLMMIASNISAISSVLLCWLLLSSNCRTSKSQGNIVRDSDKDDEDDVSTRRDAKKFNFASQAAGAIILDKSPSSAKGYGNLLNDDKDKYGISPCHEKKWVVIGLSEDITVTAVEMSNFEKYSSMLKDFELLASTVYPTEEWIDLGMYTAQPMLGSQLFNVTNSASYTRYLKFKFRTHYLDEALCTLSQIKVFGMTVIASFQQEVQQSDDHMRDMLSHLQSSHHDEDDELLDDDSFAEEIYDDGYGADDEQTLSDLQRDKVAVEEKQQEGAEEEKRSGSDREGSLEGDADQVQTDQSIDNNLQQQQKEPQYEDPTSVSDAAEGTIDVEVEKHSSSVEDGTVDEDSSAGGITTIDSDAKTDEEPSLPEVDISIGDKQAAVDNHTTDSNLLIDEPLSEGNTSVQPANGIYSGVFGEYVSAIEGYWGKLTNSEVAGTEGQTVDSNPADVDMVPEESSRSSNKSEEQHHKEEVGSDQQILVSMSEVGTAAVEAVAASNTSEKSTYNSSVSENIDGADAGYCQLNDSSLDSIAVNPGIEELDQSISGGTDPYQDAGEVSILKTDERSSSDGSSGSDREGDNGGDLNSDSSSSSDSDSGNSDIDDAGNAKDRRVKPSMPRSAMYATSEESDLHHPYSMNYFTPAIIWGAHLGSRKAAISPACARPGCVYSSDNQPFLEESHSSAAFTQQLHQHAGALVDAVNTTDAAVNTSDASVIFENSSIVNGTVAVSSMLEESGGGDYDAAMEVTTASYPLQSVTSALTTVKRIIESKLSALGIPVLHDAPTDTRRMMQLPAPSTIQSQLNSSSQNDDEILAANSGNTTSREDARSSSSSSSNNNSSKIVNNTIDSKRFVSPIKIERIKATTQNNSNNASKIARNENRAVPVVPIIIDRDTATGSGSSSSNSNASGGGGSSSGSGISIPSNCFETLRFAEFQKKMRYKLQAMGGGNYTGNGDSINGSSEANGVAPSSSLASADNNVFRALMQKIKTLEMSNAIVEKYIVQMSECYTAVTRELLIRTRKDQDAGADSDVDSDADADVDAQALINRRVYDATASGRARKQKTTNSLIAKDRSRGVEAPLSFRQQLVYTAEALLRVTEKVAAISAAPIGEVTLSNREVSAALFAILIMLCSMLLFLISLTVAFCVVNCRKRS